MLTRDELFALALDANLVPDGMFTQWDVFGGWQRAVCNHFGGPRDRVILDIGCGPLRFGAFVAEDLGAGRFVGLEPFGPYVDVGRAIAQRLGIDDRVTLVQTADFDVPADLAVDFAMCHAVFTHLSYAQIWACLEKTAPVMRPGAPLVFTFNLSGIGREVHRGRLYAEQMPLISAHLASEQVFVDFSERCGGRYERLDAIPHPGQECAVLYFDGGSA